MIQIALSKQIPTWFLHEEIVLRDSILGHKFQCNVLIMRKGNIQCFVVSPVNDTVTDLI